MAPAIEEVPAIIRRGKGYAAFVVALILLANILNYADRTILSVLAEPIKRDLGISDGQIGFLFGTSFVLFHGLTGLAAARITDSWLRNRLLAIGIACWSAMTAMSGFAQNYAQLAVARFGVGLGESTIGPVGHALLADLFPPAKRARIFAIYLCGPFVGSALCIALAGKLLGAWPEMCGSVGLCAMRGWQAAFLAFGIPGLAVALLVLAMGEPAPDVERRRAGRPLREGLFELSMIVPPFSLFRLAAIGGGTLVLGNLAAAALVAGLATVAYLLTRDIAQWLAVGIAAYAAISWAQGLPHREPLLFRRTIGSRAYMLLTFAMCVPGMIAASVGFWSIPLALRTFHLSPHEASASLGLAVGGGSLVGTLFGGWLGDRLRRRTPNAAIWITAASLAGSAVAMIGLANAPDIRSYALVLACATFCGGLWSAPNAALIQELILPSIRARGAVIFSLTLMLISLSFGPYTVGRIADAAGSLKIGLAFVYALIPLFAVLAFAASRAIPGALARNAASGEV